MSNFYADGAYGSSALSCWAVSDGKTGMENQCLGLAEALGLKPIVKRIKLRSPWKQFSPFLRHGLAYAFRDDGDPVAPPWPDVLIGTGRVSVMASLYVRRASRAGGNRGTFTIQIQNPVIDFSRFDLVIVPRHDEVIGTNILTMRGSVHRITPQVLKEEGAKLLPQLAHLPSPRIAVMIGGTNAVYSLAPREMRVLAKQLAGIAQSQGGLMVTPSRRTGAENIEILRGALKDTPSFIWDGQGANPYFGMLALADVILVTCDSINMVTEACSTGKPVMVIDLPGGSEKFRRFHQSMRDDGMTRPFSGRIETWEHPPLDDMKIVTERVKQILGNHFP